MHVVVADIPSKQQPTRMYICDKEKGQHGSRGSKCVGTRGTNGVAIDVHELITSCAAAAAATAMTVEHHPNDVDVRSKKRKQMEPTTTASAVAITTMRKHKPQGSLSSSRSDRHRYKHLIAALQAQLSTLRSQHDSLSAYTQEKVVLLEALKQECLSGSVMTVCRRAHSAQVLAHTLEKHQQLHERMQKKLFAVYQNSTAARPKLNMGTRSPLLSVCRNLASASMKQTHTQTHAQRTNDCVGATELVYTEVQYNRDLHTFLLFARVKNHGR
jgi:hypothetical protein